MKRRGRPKTVCGNLTEQVERLKNTLMTTSCSYIRCVKPNPTLFPPVETFMNDMPKHDTKDVRQEKSMNITRI